MYFKGINFPLDNIQYICPNKVTESLRKRIILHYFLPQIIFILLFQVVCSSQTILSKEAWVDSVYNSLTTEERIGQLFMIRAFSKLDQAEIEKVTNYVRQYNVGGICFFQGSPTRQTELTNFYQSISKTPLMIGIDGEWGVSMRFPESAINFPKQLTLGAVTDNSLIADMGKEIAEQCKKMGIHVNFAPVVDVNNNPVNPVINYRSFGEDIYNVTNKSLAYMKAMQDNGVMACAKHFPGHGDTDVDSHYDLPIIKHGIDRLHNIELFPFKALINEGVGSIMVAHLHLPILDNRENRSTTLSYRTVTDLLKNELNFKGIIFTDAMEMKGVAKHFPQGVADAEALLAGNDMILLPEDLPSGVNSIKSYIEQGKIAPSQIEYSVKKILSSKFDYKVYERSHLNATTVSTFINRPEAIAIKSKLIESAITLVNDDFNQLPFTIKSENTWMGISIGSSPKNTFLSRLKSYADFCTYNITKDIPLKDKEDIIAQACDYDYVVVGLHDMSRLGSQNFGITNETLSFIEELNNTTNVILCIFGSPYSLKNFDKIPSVLVAYEDDDVVQDITAQSLFGANGFIGKLPVTASKKFKYNHGIIKRSTGILGYAIAERVNMSTKALEEIDNIAYELIKAKAAPGCQVLVAKDNKIIYHKSFGSHTYENLNYVKVDDVYDLASITKIIGGTLGLMKLYDQHRISTESTLGTYLTAARNTNKEKIMIGDMLIHQSGLQAWIPFYEATIIKKGKDLSLAKDLYKNLWQSDYTTPVAQKLFLKDSYKDSIWSKIYASDLLAKKEYKYSDLGFFFAKDLIENISGRSMNNFLYSAFYSSLGLRKTTFNPIQRISLNEIVPSEIDNYWRNQTVHGTVHDMGAAMLGGVSGHAGLFSNSYEVAVIMQMLLNGGSYGGYKFLNKETIKFFTTRYNGNSRRGLGFDMKELDVTRSQNLADEAPSSTFGHSGFTGTCTYADPENNIVYVFLSNRTYPTMDNNLLIKNNYRTRIQSVIYKAMIK